jgi:putative copper export protein
MGHFLGKITLWFCQNSIYGGLISDTAIGIFAIWEGILLIAENRMRPYEHLAERDKKRMFWNLIREFNIVILPIIILFFAIGVVLQYMHIRSL